MHKPTILLKGGASEYAGPNEVIATITGRNGAGVLLSVMELDSGELSVALYRGDMVRVSIGSGISVVTTGAKAILLSASGDHEDGKTVREIRVKLESGRVMRVTIRYRRIVRTVDTTINNVVALANDHDALLEYLSILDAKTSISYK